MKNFLLAVALLSIGTAAAAGADNLSLTTKAKAAKARQMLTEACYKDLDDGAVEKGLNEDLRRKLASAPFIKEFCECQGRKLEDRLLKGLVVGPETDLAPLLQQDRKECADAFLR